jgi:hypothetical protein
MLKKKKRCNIYNHFDFQLLNLFTLKYFLCNTFSLLSNKTLKMAPPRIRDLKTTLVALVNERKKGMRGAKASIKGLEIQEIAEEVLNRWMTVNVHQEGSTKHKKAKKSLLDWGGL